MIPKTTTYKQFREKKTKEEAATNAIPIAPGQTTLQNGFGGAVQAGYLEGRSERSSREESNGVTADPKLLSPLNGSPIADRTLNLSVHGHPSQLMQGDMEMEDEALSS